MKDTFSRPVRFSFPRLHVVAAVALLAVQAALLWQHLNYASVTTDEFAHLPQALGYIRSGDPDFLIANPPSGPALAALAVRRDPAVRFDFSQVLLPSGDAHDPAFFEWGVKFQEWNRDGYHRAFHRPRMVIAGLTLALSALAFLFARMLAGPRAGLVALFLFTFSPEFIAHGSLVTTDATMALATVFFVFSFYLYARRRAWWLLPLPGIAVGLLLLAKHSAILLLPWVPVFLWMREGKTEVETSSKLSRRAGRLAMELIVVGVAAWVVVTLPYHLGTSLEVPHEAAGVWPAENPPGLSAASRIVFKLSTPMPKAWRRALLLLLRDAGRPFPMYFLGRVRLDPSFWYYPVAFLLKTPLALILLLLGAKAGALFSTARRIAIISALVWAGLPSAYYYLLLCLVPGKQYGIRLAMPGLGLLLIFTAVAAVGMAPGFSAEGSLKTEIPKNKKKLIKLTRLLMVVLLGWYAVDTLSAAPNLIGYFNEIAGGPRLPHHGDRYLADSNLDWGQDWKGLANWQEKLGDTPIRLAPFGLIDPALFGGKYLGLECPLPSGPVAVSWNLILGIDPFGQSPPCLSALAGREPDDRVGTSVLIYHLP